MRLWEVQTEIREVRDVLVFAKDASEALAKVRRGDGLRGEECFECGWGFGQVREWTAISAREVD